MPGGPELFSIARNFPKVRHIFILFLILWVFLRFPTNICVKRVQISPEVVFYEVKYQNLRPNFTSARKNIFGKVVNLASQIVQNTFSMSFIHDTILELPL